MKTKSSLESAFFNPRALIGFGFGAVGLLLGLVAFIALPKPSALAIPAPCTEVEFTEGKVPGGTSVTMESHGKGYPNSPCTIYYTISNIGVPPNPTHSSAIYFNPIVVPYGQTRIFKAFGHKLHAQPEDSAITTYFMQVDDPGN